MSDRPLMQLHLTELTEQEVFGIYGPKQNIMPQRMRFLQPEAATAYRKANAEKEIRVSDMLRTPESSLNAVKTRPGAMPPGWSGHNFGFSIDIDVDWMMKNHKFKDKMALDLWMQGHGWYCHNILGEKRSLESWHFNYFGPEAEHYLSFRTNNKRTWSEPVSRKIVEVYGKSWDRADSATVQTALKKLRMYGGDIDGAVGPITKEAIKVFQRAWGLKDDGVAGPNTRRVMMLVSADRIISK